MKRILASMLARPMNFRAVGAIVALLVLIACEASEGRALGRRAPGGRGMRGQRTQVPASRSAASAEAGVRRTLQVGDETRQYYFYRPASASGSLPLVIVYHGGQGTAQKIADQTGFSEVADRNGFAVVYPESIDHWNDGRDATKNFGDDTQFTSELIDELVRTESIDRTRVYATGASNGGVMTIRLACELASKIAAFAAVSASFPDNFMSRCRPARPVPIMIVHGSADPLIPREGATIEGGSRRLGGTITPLAETVDFWRRTNGRQAPPKAYSLPNTANDGTKVRVTEYEGCAAGTEVIFVDIVGGGHTWPGARVEPNAKAGRVCRDIDGTQYIWDFFREHRLPDTR